MKKGGHYDASGLIEAQFEPGSRGRVLKNLLVIVKGDGSIFITFGSCLYEISNKSQVSTFNKLKLFDTGLCCHP